MTKLYANRDTAIQDQMGNHYNKHLKAITEEGLYSKRDIAAELAHRDIIINILIENLESVSDLIVGDSFAVDAARLTLNKINKGII